MSPSTRAIVTTRTATHTQNTPVNSAPIQLNQFDTIALTVTLCAGAVLCLISIFSD